MYGPNSTWSSNGGFKLFDRYARNLPGVERLSLYQNSHTVHSYLDGRKVSSGLKRTDDEYLAHPRVRVPRRRTDSAPPTSPRRDFVAVINRTTRQRIFDGRNAVGQTLEADGQRFRVIGVVEDVSEMRSVPYADIWVPYTTAKTDAYKREIMGDWNAMALARDKASMAGIREEFNSRLLRVELPQEGYQAIVAPFETKFAGFARLMPTADRKDPESQVWRMVALLLDTRAALHPHPHGQPREHQHQPNHGAGV